jgi:hypothetical protein
MGLQHGNVAGIKWYRMQIRDNVSLLGVFNVTGRTYVIKVTRFCMQKFQICCIAIGIILFSNSSMAESVHWSAKVKWVTVKEDNSAWVGLDSPYAPNPAGSTWDCSSGIVWLGVKDSPAPRNMLSAALTLYTTQKSVRIGVRGSGANCEAYYLSARE